MIHTTEIYFSSKQAINPEKFNAINIHGFVIKVLTGISQQKTEWLHDHIYPKPFSLATLFTEAGQLAGLRVNSMTDEVDELFKKGFELARDSTKEYKLGNAVVFIEDIKEIVKMEWESLGKNSHRQNAIIRFLSPTSFKKGEISVHFPLPINFFQRPILVWERFAPEELTLPNNLHRWLSTKVTVTEHEINTVKVKLSNQLTFTGFVGDVKFHAIKGPNDFLNAFQQLTDLSTFSGTGHKTTMGMGVVVRLD